VSSVPPLIIRRAARRLKGFLWSIWYGLIAPCFWLRYRLQLLRAGVSDKYIRRAFSYLVQLGIEDYVAGELATADGAIGLRIVRAAGLELHVVDEIPVFEVVASEFVPGDQAWIVPKLPGDAPQKMRRIYEFVLFQDHTGQLVVHERRDSKRWIQASWNEFSKGGMTDWWEVFRSGRRAESLRFVEYLKRLYGDGPKPGDDAHAEPMMPMPDGEVQCS
jgi:hypothetical protein